MPMVPAVIEPAIPGTGRLSRRMALLFALLTATIWGTAYVAAKYALRDLPPFTAAASRFVLAAALMWPLLVLTKGVERIEKRDVPWFLAAGLLQTTLYFALQYVGIGLTTAANTALIVNTRPIFVAILSALVLRELLGWRKLTGILLAFVGVLLLILGGSGGFRLERERALGDLLIVLNALSGAMGIVVLKKVLERYSALSTAVYSITVGALGLIPLALVEIWRQGWPAGSVLSWGAVVYMAVACTAVASALWYNALSQLSASETAVFLYLTPIISVVLSALLLGETITVWLLLGGALVLIGAYATVAVSGRGAISASREPVV